MKASKFSDAQKAFTLKQGADGVSVGDLCRTAGISQVTYFNWKTKYDGMLPPDMRRLNQRSATAATKAAISASTHTVQRGPSDRDFGNRPSIMRW